MSGKDNDDEPLTRLVPQDLRIEYTRGQLVESEVSADPIEQFSRWFADAEGAGILEPNAMTLATADASGAPSARIVLLKAFDVRGFTFFTNYGSRKCEELIANPRAALVLYWQPLERQVRIEGAVERTSRQESDVYFHTRPREAQLGAWVSQQSQVIGSRADLEKQMAELRARFGDGPIPLPDFWGGYRVVPRVIEFWQGRASRLHDRLRYSRTAQGGWLLQRLSP
jgi:pyridoxamine 5'-phosphate oxidase